MTRDKEEILIKKYPKLFVDTNKPPTQSAMCFGMECGDGWYDLIDETCLKIQKVLKGRELRFTQVKEKFGGLRIYTYPYIEKVEEIIWKAEEESLRTCENCGSKETAKVRGEGWVYTRCDKCWEKLQGEKK